METGRLLITELTMDMAMDIHLNSLDPDTRRFVPDEVFETPADARKALAYLIRQYGSVSGPLVYALITKDGGRNIGYVQLVPMDDGKWEIGFHVAEPYTGQGFATEAVSAWLPVIAERVGAAEVYGIRLPENAASGRVLEKCGFREFFRGRGRFHGSESEIAQSIWQADDHNRVCKAPT